MQAIQEIYEIIGRGGLPPDELLDALLPEDVRTYADQHFAGTYAISLACNFLISSSAAHILDIGSGTGKFCLLGALLHKEAQFTGVEYRDSFVQIAENLRLKMCLENVNFQCKNILDYPFSAHTGVFMFNPFLEHRNVRARMQDFTDDLGREGTYFSYVRNQFTHCRSGIRLATFHVDSTQVPENFNLVDRKMGGTLSFYISE